MKVQYGIELKDVYDGVSIWVDLKGNYINRWQGEGSERERLTQEYIDKGDIL